MHGVQPAPNAMPTRAEAPQAAERPEGFADVQFWVDTRDTRDVSRATRFCHRFQARLVGLGTRGALDVEVSQRPIARAVAVVPGVKGTTNEMARDG